MEHASVVEQYVDFAEALESPGDRLATLVSETDIGANEKRVAAVPDDGLNNLLATLWELRPVIAIAAPSPAKRSAVALPIPEVPPVISATFPSSLILSTSGIQVYKLFVGPLAAESAGGFRTVHDIDVSGGERGVPGGKERKQRSDLLGLRVSP